MIKTTTRNVIKPFFFINFDIAVAISFRPFSLFAFRQKNVIVQNA